MGKNSALGTSPYSMEGRPGYGATLAILRQQVPLTDLGERTKAQKGKQGSLKIDCTQLYQGEALG